MEKDWCWRAAERRSQGLLAPENPMQCMAPCPSVSPRGKEIIDLLRVAGMQLRVGFDGAYALDWNVVARLADDAGYDTDAAWWELLGTAERELVAVFKKKKQEPATGE